jgi:hypothetical protein
VELAPQPAVGPRCRSRTDRLAAVARAQVAGGRRSAARIEHTFAFRAVRPVARQRMSPFAVGAGRPSRE